MPRRISINIDGFAHANPVPVACRIGPHLTSGVLTGRDPESREMPESLDAQITNIFAHVRAVMTAAGGTTCDILKLTVYLAHYRDRDALNREWLAMFPDPEHRPTRQVMAATFDGATLVQADLTAILDV